MLKRYRFIVMLSLAVAAIASTNPGTTGTLRAQNAHVYLEEFTGAWCGFCVRGANAIERVEAQFPGQIAAVCYHVAQGAGEPDAMDNAQGDSINAGIGFPAGEGEAGFPNGWTNRTSNGSTWNGDPGAWADSVQMLFEGTGYAQGTVDPLVGQPASVVCMVDKVSFNPANNMITARVTATFAQALTGDLRLNLMVTEDSVTGPSGSVYDQHNYYTKSIYGSTYPNNPYYAEPAAIPGWEHMHVFREAVAGIHGQAGIIPPSVTAGQSFSMTVSFPIPTTVVNPNHVHLVGLVHQYSATVAANNAVFDAMEVPLTTTPVSFEPNLITASFDDVSANNGFAYAKAPGDTTFSISVQNNGSGATSVMLMVDPRSPLPTGWSATFSPNPVPLDEGATGSVIMTVSAPEQSNLIIPNILTFPSQSGEYIAQGSFSGMYMLSNNTHYGIYSENVDNALLAAMPDSIGIHTAIFPLNSSAFYQNYDYSNFGAVFINNPELLDWTSNVGQFSVVPTLQIINDMLNGGGKVFVNSELGLTWAFDPSTNAGTATQTDAVQTFYEQMGLDWTSTRARFSQNQSTGQYTVLSFDITGEKNDPIGNALSLKNSANDNGQLAYSAIFSIDSVSSPVFYSDDKAQDIIGARYVDSATGGRLVYLGFALDEISVPAKADTIAARSIKWLFANNAPSGVAPVASSSTGITASPNPFNGISRIQYNASQDELNVTFAAYDLLGRQVAALVTNNESGNVYSTTFDASKLAAGTYTIVAHSSKGTHEIRVVNQQ